MGHNNMAGITYQLVKKYEDRFIYSIIKWNSKYYSPTSIGVSLVVDDISKFDEMSVEYGWNEDELLSKEQELVDEFLHTFIARYQMGKIERDTFEGILDGLKVGQGINELKKSYRIERNAILDRPKNEAKAQALLIKEEKLLQRQLEEKEKQRRKQQREERKQKRLEELHIQIKKDKEVRKIREKEKEEKKARQRTLKEFEKNLKERNIGVEYDVFRAVIHEPSFGRYFESPPEFFDYIEVDVGLTMLVFDQDIVPLVKLYKDKITQDVLDSIKNDENFKQYGIPINFIKLERISLNKESRELHYLFVLKEVPTNK